MGTDTRSGYRARCRCGDRFSARGDSDSGADDGSYDTAEDAAYCFCFLAHVTRVVGQLFPFGGDGGGDGNLQRQRRYPP